MIHNYLKKSDIEMRAKSISDYLLFNHIYVEDIDVLKITLNLIYKSYSLGGDFSRKGLLLLLQLFIQNNSLQYLIDGKRAYPAAEEIEKYTYYVKLIEKELIAYKITMSPESVLMFAFDIISSVFTRDTRAYPVTDNEFLSAVKKEIERKRYLAYIFIYAGKILYDQYLVLQNKYIGHIQIDEYGNIDIHSVFEQEADAIKKIFDKLKIKKLDIDELVNQFKQILKKEGYKEIAQYNGILHEFLDEENEFEKGEFEKALIS